jgi:hypothetical protein
VEVNPNDAELHTVLGVLYHLSSSFDLAIQEFRRAVELRPGVWPAHARVGGVVRVDGAARGNRRSAAVEQAGRDTGQRLAERGSR